jgi:hypothetical protein
MSKIQTSTTDFDEFNADILRDVGLRKAYSATAMKAFIRMMEQWNNGTWLLLTAAPF